LFRSLVEELAFERRQLCNFSLHWYLHTWCCCWLEF
jgi:hypothetical protein